MAYSFCTDSTPIATMTTVISVLLFLCSISWILPCNICLLLTTAASSSVSTGWRFTVRTRSDGHLHAFSASCISISSLIKLYKVSSIFKLSDFETIWHNCSAVFPSMSLLWIATTVTVEISCSKQFNIGIGVSIRPLCTSALRWISFSDLLCLQLPRYMRSYSSTAHPEMFRYCNGVRSSSKRVTKCPCRSL